jgi:hypothetical protein
MTTHIIETDFEPDDAIAIVSHAALNDGVNLIVIVGESKPNNKIKLVNDFFNILTKEYPNAYSSVKIIQGFGSKKKYPAEEQLDIPEDTEEVILKNYVDAYASGPAFAFMMKPPREAMITKVNCPDTIVYCYGSFNWRTLKMETSAFTDLMSRYKTFYYFDSFTAIGAANSGMFKFDSNPINDLIKGLIVKWNNHIIDSCKKDLLTETDEKSIERTKKIITNVEAGINEQFVMADVCLLMCPFPTEQVELVEVSPYTKWTKSETSNVFVFDGNFGLRRELLLANITKLFTNT